ncbi:MAG: ferrochelatase [Candidatus Bipolaricaulia bacterium]
MTRAVHADEAVLTQERPVEAEPQADETIGVLLMAYGNPDSLEDVKAYYTHIRGGRVPSRDQVEDLERRYRCIGGRSPLLEITWEQAWALEERLNAAGDRFRVYIGMKHWHPFIAETVEEIAADGVYRVVALALAPHYSRMSVGGYIEAVRAAKKQLKTRLNLSFVTSWNDHPRFLRAVAEVVEDALLYFPEPVRDRVPIVFTAHSLPERILAEGDPYPRELLETCEGVAELLGLAAWQFAYQSAGHTPEPWLGPDILEVLEELSQADHHHVLIVPVGFVADHLEILYDIDVECQERAKELEMQLRRTESMNTRPTFIAALAAVVREHLNRDRSAPR